MEETEEDIRGEMSDDLQLLDLEAGRWYDVTLKSEQSAAQAPAEDVKEPQEVEKETVTGRSFVF